MDLLRYSQILAISVMVSLSSSGCSNDPAPYIDPVEEKAEIEKSREENARRGWIDVKPVTVDDLKATQEKANSDGPADSTSSTPAPDRN